MISDDFFAQLNDDAPRRDADGHQVEERARPTGPESEADRTIRNRWGGDPLLLKEGWLGVPRVFFISAATFGLTPAETAFVLHLMSFKWSEADPFPSYRLLAHRLGVSPKQVQKYARQLEEKGLLRRVKRLDDTTGDRSSNAFDLQPLFDSMLLAARGISRTGRKVR